MSSEYTKSDHVKRGLYMLLFWIFLRMSLVLTALIAVIQWAVLFSQEKPLSTLQSFSGSLNQYQQHILHFITFKSDDKVFPFTDWPAAKEDD